VLNGLDEINRARVLRWLGRQIGRCRGCFATHAWGCAAGATHRAGVDHGRIVYGGALRGAPLTAGSQCKPRRASPAVMCAPCGHAAGAARAADQRAVYLTAPRARRDFPHGARGEFWVIRGATVRQDELLRHAVRRSRRSPVGERSSARASSGVAWCVQETRGPRRSASASRSSEQLHRSRVVQSGRHASGRSHDAPSAADRSAARRTLALFV